MIHNWREALFCTMCIRNPRVWIWLMRNVYYCLIVAERMRQLILMMAVRFWASICMYIYIYIYVCALPSRFIKECNTVSNASAYCRKHRRAWHAWFQRLLIVDQCKTTQVQKRKLRQSANENKVKSDDAKRRLAKQWQGWTDHRAPER